jgi:predicted permease
MLETVWQDVRYGLRSLRRTPEFTSAAILTLALGIGAGTAVFSIIDGVLVRPLPYVDPDRIVRLAEGYEGAAPLRTGARLGNVTYHALKDAEPRTVAAIEGYTEGGDALVEIDGGRTLIHLARVTPGLFGLLGISPSVGRFFDNGDAAEGSEPVVVLSDGLWRERFASDAAVVGRTVAILGQPYRVIGVTERGFVFPDQKARLWALLDVPRPTGPPQNPFFTTFFAVARLRPGATAAQAAAEATAVARGIDPKPLAARITFGDGGAAFVRATPMLDEMTSGVEAALIVVAAGIACILLIVCVNVANLFLSRGAARHRELAVRTALGANWGALARQLLTESLVLSLIGGALGVVLAFWIVRALPLLAPADFPRVDNVQVDFRVLAVAVLLSLFTGVVAAVAPIVGVARVDLARAFRGEGTSGAVAHGLRDRMRGLLLTAESAFAVVLLVAAVLLARSFLNLIQVDAGYTREGVVVADVFRPDTSQESAQRYAPLMRQALERVRSLPGVTAAAIGSMSPLDGNTSLQGFPVPGSLPAAPLAGGTAPRTALTRSYAVMPGYESAMGLRLRAGRFLVDSDEVADPVRWVVNEEFARLYLPEHPVGRGFPWRRGNQDVQLEIVGVVGNVLKDGNAGTPSPEIYRILRSTEPFFNYQIIARTTGDPDAIVPALRNVVREVAPDATVNIVPLSQRFSDSVAQPRLATTVFGTLAVLASGLTALGLFAALSYSLSLRRQEFGVRVAVGATTGDLVRMAIGQGIAPTVIGILIGIVASAGVTRFMQGVLFGITPLDVLSFVAAPSVLVPVALAACLLPAFRAARVDPMTTLRAE